MVSILETEAPGVEASHLKQKGRTNLMFVIVGLGIGGTEGQLLELASRLDPNRFDISVCSLKGEEAITQELRERGIRVICMRGKGVWDFRVVWNLAQTIIDLKPDILHSFLFYANILSRILGKILQVPVVIGSYRNALVWRNHWEWILDWLTISWNHTITCCSEAVRQRLIDSFPRESEKCVAIHNGVNFTRFGSQSRVEVSDLSVPVGMLVVGTVCRLFEPQKGLAVLLHAFSEMMKQGRVQACQLLLVGEGPAKDSLKKLVSRLGLESNVQFLGARRDVERILPIMDVFVLSSLSEGFGISIVEAMSAGIPVVATHVGGVPEVVLHGETGLLVPPGNTAAMAQAMEVLLLDDAKAKALGRRGQERAHKQFSIERAVQRHEELYDRIRLSAHIHQSDLAVSRGM